MDVLGGCAAFLRQFLRGTVFLYRFLSMLLISAYFFVVYYVYSPCLSLILQFLEDIVGKKLPSRWILIQQ